MLYWQMLAKNQSCVRNILQLFLSHFTVYLILLCNKCKRPYPRSRLCRCFPPLTRRLKSADCSASARTGSIGRLTSPRNWTTGNWFSQFPSLFITVAAGSIFSCLVCAGISPQCVLVTIIDSLVQ